MNQTLQSTLAVCIPGQPRNPAGTQRLATLLGAVLCVLAAGSAQAQITVGNSVFPQAGETLRYAIDMSPSPTITVTPPGGFQTWDFSSLKPSSTWVETLQPAASSAGAEFFPGATLVYTQTAPAAARFPMLPGSNGAQVFLQVTGNRVNLTGFYGGSDAGYLGVGAYAAPQCGESDPPQCGGDLRTVSMTRYRQPLALMSAPTQFFDIRSSVGQFSEIYPPALIPALIDVPYTALQVSSYGPVGVASSTVVDAFGTLLLPGGSFQVLREKTTLTVALKLEARVQAGTLVTWYDFTDRLAAANPDVHWGVWQQVSYRYFDNVSKESLAITRSPIALASGGDSGGADPLAIESVQFKNLSPIPEPQSAWLFLVGLSGTALVLRAGKRRAGDDES
jgi:hypothetical protein